MNFIFSLLILTTVLLLTVLLLFVLGKLVWLERLTQTLLSREGTTPNNAAESDADPYFYGLGDEALWRAMSGEYEANLEPLELDEVRPRFALALGKAVTRLVKEAADESTLAIASIKNSLDIFTIRGRVKIWLPPVHANALAEIGRKLKAAPPQLDSASGRAALDEVLSALYKEAKLERDNEAWTDIGDALFPREESAKSETTVIPTETSSE
jgi:hypothetical protein